MGFHSLRHSFVTMCAVSGVPLPVVQALCGHGSPAIQKAYIHVGAQQAQMAVNSMPDISSGAVKKQKVVLLPQPRSKVRDELNTLLDKLPDNKLRALITLARKLDAKISR
ncbi:MAG: hypothetical protein A2X49_01515 [Lentisphaerae bacterium GWF2_52_8]|nr:MAG: hypothetical protein A2X49_01515 [Lentisphaerae bacterium GWF2_52_8]